MNPHFVVQVFYSQGYQIAAIIAVATLLLTCLWAIFSDRVRDGVIGRAIYSVAAMACAAALLHMSKGVYPQRTTIVLEVCAAVWAVRQITVYYFWDAIRGRYFFELRRLRSQQKANDRH